MLPKKAVEGLALFLKILLDGEFVQGSRGLATAPWAAIVFTTHNAVGRKTALPLRRFPEDKPQEIGFLSAPTGHVVGQATTAIRMHQVPC